MCILLAAGKQERSVGEDGWGSQRGSRAQPSRRRLDRRHLRRSVTWVLSKQQPEVKFKSRTRFTSF